MEAMFDLNCSPPWLDLNCTPPAERDTPDQNAENDQMDEDVRGGEQVNEENDQIDEDVGGGATDKEEHAEKDALDEEQAAADEEEHAEQDAGDEMEVDASGVQQAVRQRKFLSDKQRYAAYVAMHSMCMKNGGKFDKDDKNQVAAFFKADVQVIQRIWRLAMRQISEGLDVDVSSKRKGRCGRKPKHIDMSKIPHIPLNQRSTIRSLAWQLGVSPSTLFTRFKAKKIKRISNCLKPLLTEKNKLARLLFCLSMLGDKKTIEGHPIFKYMYNYIHIDEKWFWLTKKNRKYYLLPEEEEPTRAVTSTQCIGKVMFITALARPRFDSAGNVTFTGKIGVWPFVKLLPAQRKSDNRPKGTLETKSITVTRDVMRETLIDSVLPAIKKAWPAEDAGQTIFLQQDNAKPHILPNDPEFREAVAKIGMDIQLVQQPANSPDVNVNDLGFYNSLESLTNCRSPKTLNDLIRDVEEEFHGYDVHTLNKIWLSLQTCMTEVLNHGGGNGYKIPHVGKTAFEARKQLPKSISCPLLVYENAVKAVEEMLQAEEEKKKEEAIKKQQEKEAREEAKKEEAIKKQQEKEAREEAKKEEAIKKQQEREAREEAKKQEAIKKQQEKEAREEAKKEEAIKKQQEKEAREEAKKQEAIKKQQEKEAREKKKQEAIKKQQEKEAREEAKKEEAIKKQQEKEAREEAKKQEAIKKQQEKEAREEAKKEEAIKKQQESEAREEKKKQEAIKKQQEREAREEAKKEASQRKRKTSEVKLAEATNQKQRKE